MKNQGRPSHSNKQRSNSRKPQNRGQKSGGGGQGQQGQGNGNQRNRNRTGPNQRNKQATELWLKPTSETLTSHIGMVAGNGNTRDNTQRKNDNRNGGQGRGRQGQGGGQDKHRQGNRPPRDRAAQQPAAPSNRPAASSVPQAPADVPRPPHLTKLVSDIEPFELFCAYHLGITTDKRYKQANINEVANRFRVDPGTIKQALKEYDMDPGELFNRDFDMALSQLDIQVAPEGVDRKELAKNIYEEFINAEKIERDWKKLLEEDRRENQKIFRD